MTNAEFTLTEAPSTDIVNLLVEVGDVAQAIPPFEMQGVPPELLANQFSKANLIETAAQAVAMIVALKPNYAEEARQKRYTAAVLGEFVEDHEHHDDVDIHTLEATA